MARRRTSTGSNRKYSRLAVSTNSNTTVAGLGRAIYRNGMIRMATKVKATSHRFMTPMGGRFISQRRK